MQAPANVEARSSGDVDCALSQIRVTASATQMRVKQRPEQNKPFAGSGNRLAQSFIQPVCHLPASPARAPPGQPMTIAH